VGASHALACSFASQYFEFLVSRNMFKRGLEIFLKNHDVLIIFLGPFLNYKIFIIK